MVILNVKHPFYGVTVEHFRQTCYHTKNQVVKVVQIDDFLGTVVARDQIPQSPQDLHRNTKNRSLLMLFPGYRIRDATKLCYHMRFCVQAYLAIKMPKFKIFFGYFMADSLLKRQNYDLRFSAYATYGSSSEHIRGIPYDCLTITATEQYTSFDPEYVINVATLGVDIKVIPWKNSNNWQLKEWTHNCFFLF